MLQTTFPLAGAAGATGQKPGAGNGADASGMPAFFAMLDAALAANGQSDAGNAFAFWGAEATSGPAFGGFEEAHIDAPDEARTWPFPAQDGAAADEKAQSADMPLPQGQPGPGDAAWKIAPSAPMGETVAIPPSESGDGEEKAAATPPADEELALALALSGASRQVAASQPATAETAAGEAVRSGADAALPRPDTPQMLRPSGRDALEGRQSDATAKHGETAPQIRQATNANAEQSRTPDLKELVARLTQPSGNPVAGGADRPPPPAPEPVSSSLLTVQQLGEDMFGQMRTGQPVQSAATPGGYSAAASARPDIPALAARIASEANAGGRRFEIQLDPPELGRIDVRLEIGRDGRMTTHLTVDRPDTLDALLRDARGLERALQSTGLKLEDAGVQFSLRDQSSFSQHQQRDEHGPGQRGSDGHDRGPGALPAAADDPDPPPRRLALGALDLRI